MARAEGVGPAVVRRPSPVVGGPKATLTLATPGAGDSRGRRLARDARRGDPALGRAGSLPGSSIIIPGRGRRQFPARPPLFESAEPLIRDDEDEVIRLSRSLAIRSVSQAR